MPIVLCTAQNPKRQNVLFILADDLGYHDLSSTGSQYYETPNIDRIAQEGMVFTNGYANSRVCSPSRVSIMTGKFPARHGITDFIGAPTGAEWRKMGRKSKLLPPSYVENLPHQYTTLPEAMKAGGYKTFFAGKWHLGGEGSYPEDHGFDFNKGGYEKGYPYNPYIGFCGGYGNYFSPFHNPKMEDVEDEKGMPLSIKLAKETVLFIEQNTDKPFFAFLSFYAVHAPIQTSREKWSKYRQKAENRGIAENGFEMGRLLPARVVQDNPVYAGLVETMDDAIGMVLDALQKQGLDDDTIIIFTSDNGGVVSGDAFATSNLPLRAGKGSSFEGGIRAPYFIKVPGLTKGRTSSIPVTGADFYPTILELTGQKSLFNEHQDGISLMPILKGKAINERPLIWHYPHYGNQGGEPSSVIRERQWKLIHYYEDGREELYNLALDREETTDVAMEFPRLTKGLSKKLFAYLDKMEAKFPEKDPKHDPVAERTYIEYKSKELATQEKNRLQFLSKDFDPGNNWWGSEKKKEP